MRILNFKEIFFNVERFLQSFSEADFKEKFSSLINVNLQISGTLEL